MIHVPGRDMYAYLKYLNFFKPDMLINRPLCQFGKSVVQSCHDLVLILGTQFRDVNLYFLVLHFAVSFMKCGKTRYLTR